MVSPLRRIIVSAQVELAIVVNEAKPHLLKPTMSSQQIARKTRSRCAIATSLQKATHLVTRPGQLKAARPPSSALLQRPLAPEDHALAADHHRAPPTVRQIPHDARRASASPEFGRSFSL